MGEMTPRFGSTFPKKWALAGMFTATIVLSIIIELLQRIPTVFPTPWWIWVMVVSNFVLIILGLAFVTLASKDMWQQIVNSALMIGTLTVLLFFYSLVP